MKFLDLLDEKIDYLFKRGKNADERCFDFFIRTVTFLLVALIVLCYASFVHAETEIDTNDYDLMDQDYFFTYTELNNHYSGSSGSNVYPEINQGFLSTYPPLWAENRIVNFESQISGISLNNESSIITDEYKKYYALFLQIDTGTDNGICRCNLISIYSKDIPLIINDGLTVLNAGLSNWYIYSEYPYVINNADFQVNYSNQYLPFQLKGNTTTEVSEGGLHAINGNVTGYLFGCDCNIYSLMYSNIYSGSTSSTRTYDSMQAMIDAIFDDSIVEKPFNLNPQADVINPVIPDPEVIESNVNHLYLEDIQVGLTSSTDRQDIMSSQVVIGIKVDDWILNHIDDYSLLVTYHVEVKDTMPFSPNDPEGSISYSLPLRQFLSNYPYSYGISEIFHSISIGDSDFLYYYTQLCKGGVKCLAKNRYIAKLPMPYHDVEQMIGSYVFEKLDIWETVDTPYTVFDFNLRVGCILYDNVSDESSSPYIKEFDLVTGTESVKFAEILRNNNPWDGEQLPQQSPIIPSGSGSLSGGGGSGDVTVTVNNDGNHKIPLNVHTKKELNDTINNYGEITDTFFDTYKNLTDETKEDGYISLLRQTLPEVSENVPIIDFMLKCAICVIALGVIIFVLKVLLF